VKIFSPETTSDVSAGYWKPYELQLTDERTLQWARYTYDVFISEYLSTKAARAGIIKIPAYTLPGYNGQDRGENVLKPQYST
jgi:hypothetical protein